MRLWECAFYFGSDYQSVTTRSLATRTISSCPKVQIWHLSYKVLIVTHCFSHETLSWGQRYLRWKHCFLQKLTEEELTSSNWLWSVFDLWLLSWGVFFISSCFFVCLGLSFILEAEGVLEIMNNSRYRSQPSQASLTSQVVTGGVRSRGRWVSVTPVVHF